MRVCARCKSQVGPTDTPGYDFACNNCDEDLYQELETEVRTDILWLVEPSNRSSPMSEALKPCPFCGGPPFRWGRIDYGQSGSSTVVECGGCGAHGPDNYHKRTDEEACRLWNDRVDQGG